MKKIYEDDNIVVKETGRDYDFIATVENKAGYPIVVQFIEDNSISVPAIERIKVDRGEWVGIEANSEGREQLEAIKKKSFNVLEDTTDYCPLGGDIENDCADCAYSCEYHYVNGECLLRDEENNAKGDKADEEVCS